MNRAYLILGGNMGNRAAMIKSAEKQLELSCGKIVLRSSFYETEAWGMENAAPFLNKVIAIETEKNPTETLATCLHIENLLGRTRTQGKYESRTIDIDILLFNDEIITISELEIPHPRMHLRRFVLLPFAEIEPSLMHPVLKKTIAALLTECTDKSQVEKKEISD
ncbi:MAG: 2-amino-4-hydroxy-6-hydroxymethyldihydropteridine diphosphokinase [Bacteroidia bacterium]|nr:2-amino-4-hydroxy-6-hydroxymethyldihydropteridine diphosphokinase [Bacteroidia bacterium]